jgi:RimJ/RimL family protein N-acetyltransferase
MDQASGIPMAALRSICDDDVQVFRRLCAGDRREEWTCRPIVSGRPTRDERREQYTYVLDDGSPAGWISPFNFNSRGRSAEFGYGLIPAQRGRGLGKRLLAAGFDLFFESMDLNKLYCQTASFNRPSVRTLESLGLTRDGVLRAHHELDGHFHDDYIYSVLGTEWLGRKT